MNALLKNRYVLTLTSLAVLGLIAILTTLRTPFLADPDSFYHIRHASLYRTEGITDSSFPWTQFSVMKDAATDLWYGFHLLLMPFARGDLLHAMQIGEMLTLMLTSFLVFAALGRLRVRFALFFTLLFLFSAPSVLYRMAMLRPHPLSLGLLLIMFAELIGPKEGISRWRTLGTLGFAALAFSSIHLSLIWMPLLVILAVLALRIVGREPLRISQPISIVAGMALGWLLRPHPFGAAQLAYTQIAKFAAAKGSGIPLPFGKELIPFSLGEFIENFWPIALLVIIAAGIATLLLAKRTNGKRGIWHIPGETRVALASSSLIAIAFTVLTFIAARRSVEIAIAFFVLGIAIFTREAVTRFELRQKTMLAHPGAMIAALIAGMLLAILPFKSIAGYRAYMQNGFRPDRFKDAALYLQDHAQSGEIVVNLHWDQFPMLFFWNQKNYYVNGMDPIFAYAYDRDRYWKLHFMAQDKAAATTCGAIRCTTDTAADTYRALKDDFRASYLFIVKARNPNFAVYLAGDKRFENVFDSGQEIIYRIR